MGAAVLMFSRHMCGFHSHLRCLYACPRDVMLLHSQYVTAVPVDRMLGKLYKALRSAGGIRHALQVG